LNTAVLTINWYSQPVRVDDMLDYINYSFAIIFALESIFKMVALGFSAFFRDYNCLFDFLIVCSSVISTALSLTFNVDFGASTTFIRAIRIVRIFKYTKSSR
jgi:voltage-dependent calcium channel T type alpha-1G